MCWKLVKIAAFFKWTPFWNLISKKEHNYIHYSEENYLNHTWNTVLHATFLPKTRGDKIKQRGKNWIQNKGRQEQAVNYSDSLNWKGDIYFFLKARGKKNRQWTHLGALYWTKLKCIHLFGSAQLKPSTIQSLIAPCWVSLLDDGCCRIDMPCFKTTKRRWRGQRKKTITKKGQKQQQQ